MTIDNILEHDLKNIEIARNFLIESSQGKDNILTDYELSLLIDLFNRDVDAMNGRHNTDIFKQWEF